MDFRTERGRARYDDLLAVADRVVVGLDFDGTLSPIVNDPDAAVIHPDAPAALRALAARVGAVVVITGRPAEQVVELGGLDDLADDLPHGATLTVLGQYGNQRWDTGTRAFSSPEPPPALGDLRAELPALLADRDASDAQIEEKGLALAVHTRRLADPQGAFDRLRGPLGEAAERHGLTLEPGRLVLEVRSSGMHKGLALRAALDEYDAAGVLFVGDDLGDLEAFEAVGSLREQGLPGVLVCSGSEEEVALAELADLVVDGPVGVVEVLTDFATDAAHGGSPTPR